MKKQYGLVGFPLGHSFSRAFFTEKFEAEGIDAEYLNFEISDIEQLSEVLKAHPSLQGFNVTIPYKQAVIPYLTSLSKQAEAIGAVNVVRVEADGSLSGHNSDVFGFTESIRPLLTNGTYTKALVLGVGGASRAVVNGLTSLGLKVTQVSRRHGVGDMTYDDLNSDVISQHTVIVNTTPLGMYPNVNEAPALPYDAVTERHVCFDLVYNPLVTQFMRMCGERGAKVSNGLEMLHLQARRAWEIWNGIQD